MAITLIARLQIDPDKATSFKAAIDKWEVANNFASDQLNFVQVCVDRKGDLTILESWHDDGTGLDVVRRSPAFHEFITQASLCSIAPISIEYLSPVGNSDNVFDRYPAGLPDPTIYPHIGDLTPIVR